MASESSRNVVHPAGGMNLQTAFQQIAEDAISQIPVIDMDSTDEESDTDVDILLPITASHSVGITQRTDLQLVQKSANSANAVSDDTDCSTTTANAAEGASDCVSATDDRGLAPKQDKSAESRGTGLAVALSDSHPTTSSGSLQAGKYNKTSASSTNFAEGDGFLESMPEQGGEDLDEGKTRQELIETLLELRDTLRAARLVNQEQFSGDCSLPDCERQSIKSAMTKLSLGPVQHIDLEALIVQATEGGLQVGNDIHHSTAAMADTSRGYSDEELLERLYALSEKQNALLEKAPQAPPKREVNEVRRVRTVTWADVGEGQRAVAVSESMACQTSPVSDISLSTDSLTSTQSVGTSTSIGSTSWHDIASPSTTMTNGSAYLARSSGLDQAQHHWAADDSRHHDHGPKSEQENTARVSAAACRLASLWTNQDSNTSSSESDGSDEDRDKDKSMDATAKHKSNKPVASISLGQGSSQRAPCEDTHSTLGPVPEGPSSNSSQRWQRMVQPLSVAGGRKHPRLSDMRKASAKLDQDSTRHSKTTTETPPPTGKSNLHTALTEDNTSRSVPSEDVHDEHAARKVETKTTGLEVTGGRSTSRQPASIHDDKVESCPRANSSSSERTTEMKRLPTAGKGHDQQISSRLSMQRERERRQSLHRQLMSIWAGMEEYHLPSTSPLFDEDITFEMSAARSLPANAPQGLLMLTINLTNGPTAKNNKTLSVSSSEYSTFVCWLLLQTSGAAESATATSLCPFHVHGLQQETVSDTSSKKAQLQLCVVISPKTSAEELHAFLERTTLRHIKTVLQDATTVFGGNTVPRLQPDSHDCGGWSLQLSQIISVSPSAEEFATQSSQQHVCNIFWHVPCDTQSGANSTSHTEVTVSSLSSHWLHRPQAMQSVFSAVFSSGLCIAGLRLAYLDANSLDTHLLLVLRGPSALMRWQEAVGPIDVRLARKTDPQSLHAIFGDDTNHQHAITYPRSQARAKEHLVRWFGPHLCTDGGVQVRLDTSCLSGKHLLSAGIQQAILIVISPQLPVHCLAIVLARCQWYGYRISCLRRRFISHEGAGLLGLPSEHGFNISSGCSAFLCQMTSENGLLKMAFLKQCLLDELKSVLLTEPACKGLAFADISNGLFFSPFPDNAQKLLLGPPLRTTTLPEIIKVHNNPELEQMATLIFTQSAMMAAGDLLCSYLLSENEKKRCVFGQAYAGVGQLCKDGPLELLGIRYVQSLPASVQEFLAKVTECSSKSLKGPMLVVTVRGIDVFNRFRQWIGHNTSQPSGYGSHSLKHSQPHTPILPTSAASALQLASLFFDHGHALVADHGRRINRHLLPPDHTSVQQQQSGRQSVALILQAWLSGPRPIATMALLKPHLTPASWCRLLRLLSQNGFTLVGAHLSVLTSDDITKLEERNLDRKVHDHLEGKTCLLLALLRENAVGKLIELVGPCDPAVACQVNPQTMRAQFGQSVPNNALHVSMSYEAAVDELKHFFPDGLCVKPMVADLIQEKIPCPGEDSLISVNRPVWDSLRDGPSSKSSLKETNCIFLTSPLLQTDKGTGMVSSQQSYSQLLTGLFAARFHPMALRLVWLTPCQLEHCCKFLPGVEADISKVLSSGPVLVLALERDNAVSCFHLYLGSPTDSRSLFCRFSKWIIAPKTVEQARCLLSYFFEEPSARVTA